MGYYKPSYAPFFLASLLEKKSTSTPKVIGQLPIPKQQKQRNVGVERFEEEIRLSKGANTTTLLW